MNCPYNYLGIGLPMVTSAGLAISTLAGGIQGRRPFKNL